VREKKSQTLMRVCVRAHERLYFFKIHQLQRRRGRVTMSMIGCEIIARKELRYKTTIAKKNFFIVRNTG